GRAARERRGTNGGGPADRSGREAEPALVGERREYLRSREAGVGDRGAGRLRARRRGTAPARRGRAPRRRAPLEKPARGELVGGGVDTVDRYPAGQPVCELAHSSLELDLRLVAEQLGSACAVPGASAVDAGPHLAAA